MRCACIGKWRPKVTHSACQSQVYFNYSTTPAPTTFGIQCVFLAPESIKGAEAQMNHSRPSSANLKIPSFHLTGESKHERVTAEGAWQQVSEPPVPSWINIHNLITFRTWPVTSTSNLEIHTGKQGHMLPTPALPTYFKRQKAQSFILEVQEGEK